MRRLAAFPGRLIAHTSQLLKARTLRDRIQVEQPRDDLVTIGSPGYGAWTIPGSLLGPESAVYAAGVGTDISFDLGLIARFGCTVHAFDPMPAAAAYVGEAANAEPRLVFRPVGLWSADGHARFFQHTQPSFVSHSATNMHRTDQFLEAPVRSVGSLMRELGHEHLDLLKLSVEGSEYELLDNVLADRIAVSVLAVEFSQPAPLAPVTAMVQRLRGSGFSLVAASFLAWGWKLTFFHREAVETSPA
jgi:FkbM family methyltransferase